MTGEDGWQAHLRLCEQSSLRRDFWLCAALGIAIKRIMAGAQPAHACFTMHAVIYFLQSQLYSLASASRSAPSLGEV